MRIALGFLALASASASATASAQTFTGTARPIDGDSLYVGNTEVRLFGIDAPEYHQVCTRGSLPWGLRRRRGDIQALA